MKFRLALLLVCILLPSMLFADSEKETDRVKDAGQVLKEILNIPDDIPKDLLNDAE